MVIDLDQIAVFEIGYGIILSVVERHDGLRLAIRDVHQDHLKSAREERESNIEYRQRGARAAKVKSKKSNTYGSGRC
jgi:hypothetical protein